MTEDALPINSVIAEVDFISPFVDQNSQSQLFKEINNSDDLDNSILKEVATESGKNLIFIFLSVLCVKQNKIQQYLTFFR